MQNNSAICANEKKTYKSEYRSRNKPKFLNNMESFYILPERMIDNAHMKFIREEAGVVERGDCAIFGRRDTMARLFDMPREMGK